MAAEVFLSPSRFLHLFKEETGYSWLEYQMKKRMDSAAELLRHTDLTISAVMEKCGMRREGVLREYILKNGAFEDAVCCGILKSEWLLAQRAAQR